MASKNTHNVATHFPRRANMYVPNLSYHSDVGTDGLFRAEINAPVAAAAAGIVSAKSIAVALVNDASELVANHRSNMADWGRNLTVVLSGAGTPSITVFGLDYLGQPMAETFTGNGTTPVVGKKAFKEVTSFSSDAVAATTVNIGYGSVLGLPFAAAVITDELVDNAVPTAGTKTAAVLTDPQTATTGDPRGTYAPHSSFLPNGSRNYVLLGIAVEGDYHGIRHYTA